MARQDSGKRNGFLTPNQQWLALTLLALLVLLAVFYFGIGFGGHDQGAIN